MALLSALALVLGFAESFITPLSPVPGMKLGLANIVVMFAFFSYGIYSAGLIALVKALFALITRGPVAFVLSASGAAMSLLLMALVYWGSNKKISVLLLSCMGAVIHNLTQLFVVKFIYGMDLFLYYGPVLVLAGLASGLINAYLLKLMYRLLRQNGSGHN